MMFGAYPDANGNPTLTALRNTSDQFEALLALLFPKGGGEEILTWQKVRDLYDRTGFGRSAIEAMGRAQRITRADRRHDLAGLCEFHIGLTHLQWHNPHGAIPQFVLARQQWAFADLTPATCLAYFAQAVTQEHVLEYEAAMINLRRASRILERIMFSPLFKDQKQFVLDMSAAIEKTQESLRKVIWPSEDAEEEITLLTTAVADAPSVNIDLDKDNPIPGHLKKDGKYVWYRVSFRSEDGFLPEITKNSWVLVNTDTAQAQVPNELVIVSSSNMNNSIWLSTSGSDEQRPSPQIALGRMVETPRTFTRDPHTGRVDLPQVKFSSHMAQSPVNIENILGIVVGYWFTNLN